MRYAIFGIILAVLLSLRCESDAITDSEVGCVHDCAAPAEISDVRDPRTPCHDDGKGGHPCAVLS